MAILQSDRAADQMRDAGQKAPQTLVKMKNAVKPGIRTFEVEGITERYRGGINKVLPLKKGGEAFPKELFLLCQGAAHRDDGLGNLQNGDDISIDIGTVINGFNGGSAKALSVERAGARMQELLEITGHDLYDGMKAALAMDCYGPISSVFRDYGESYGYRIVRNYVGHGIGRLIYEDPQIPNYGSADRGPRLKSGMTLAIEPMINLGTHEVKTLDNEWTVITKACGLSAMVLQ